MLTTLWWILLQTSQNSGADEEKRQVPARLRSSSASPPSSPIRGKPNTDVASRKVGIGKRLNQRKKRRIYHA
jgi:hypothetical protein